jgi:2-polyprenyl-3-methyl-5-hydroxy-6-metoxy-1,4-benzoquinol methylase
MEERDRCRLSDQQWAVYRRQARQGKDRSQLFHDMVLADLALRGPGATLLDIGCGHGIHGNRSWQESLSAAAGRSIGIEPDRGVAVGDYFCQVHRCILEEAPLPAGSIDVAMAAFVLEHVADPQRFFGKLHEALVEGGVFLGMTINRRHAFALCSNLVQRMGLKRPLLAWVRRGGPAVDVETYRTFYRSNTRRALVRQAAAFRELRWMSFDCVGQFDAYLPPLLHRCAHAADRLARKLRLPGPTAIVRLQK